MINTKHTPTPWASLEKDDYNRVCVIDGNGHSICICDANHADLIVRAVNSLDPLKEALEWIDQITLSKAYGLKERAALIRNYMNGNGRAALKLAKEG